MLGDLASDLKTPVRKERPIRKPLEQLEQEFGTLSKDAVNFIVSLYSSSYLDDSGQKYSVEELFVLPYMSVLHFEDALMQTMDSDYFEEVLMQAVELDYFKGAWMPVFHDGCGGGAYINLVSEGNVELLFYDPESPEYVKYDSACVYLDCVLECVRRKVYVWDAEELWVVKDETLEDQLLGKLKQKKIAEEY